MMGYGTGAIMAVPAHDERDNEFAKKYGLQIVEVLKPDLGKAVDGSLFTGDGVAFNSGLIDGMPTAKAKATVIGEAEKQGIGKKLSSTS